MSPEQIGNPVDRRTDIFAASIVIWEALAGERLFMGDQPAALVQAVLTAPIRRLTEVVPQLPPELDEVVLRGLSRDPNQRFASARDMAIALERACRPASSREVGEWVELLAGPALRERQALVESLEAESSMSDEGARELQARLASGHGMVAPASNDRANMSDSSVSRVGAVRRPAPGAAESFGAERVGVAKYAAEGFARLTSQTQAARSRCGSPRCSAARLAVLGIVTAIGVLGVLLVLGLRAVLHRSRANPVEPPPPASVTAPVVTAAPDVPSASATATEAAPPDTPKDPSGTAAAGAVKDPSGKDPASGHTSSAHGSTGKDPSNGHASTTKDPSNGKTKHVDPTPKKTPPATGTPNDCDNPFTLDPVTGIKRPKVHCFKK